MIFSYIFFAFILGEPKGLSRLVLSPGFTGHYSVSLIFSGGALQIWTGAQLPQGTFINYGRFFWFLSILLFLLASL